MKKKIIIPITVIAVIFITVLVFGKALVSNLLFSETAINYTVEEEKSVSLKKGDYVLFGEYLEEPILWLVVDVVDSKPLLQTEHIITFKAFDANHGDDSDIGRFGKAQWENSSLKKWLNSKGEVDYGEYAPDKKAVFNGKNSYENEKGFLSENNFTSKEIESISEDGVFLLSKAQISKYFDSTMRQKTATKSAVLQDESSYIITSSRRIWYWTSSAAGTNRTSVTTVTSGGGFYRASAFDGVTGVCPALYLKSNNITCFFGNGSEEKPFVITEVKK